MRAVSIAGHRVQLTETNHQVLITGDAMVLAVLWARYHERFVGTPDFTETAITLRRGDMLKITSEDRHKLPPSLEGISKFLDDIAADITDDATLKEQASKANATRRLNRAAHTAAMEGAAYAQNRRATQDYADAVVECLRNAGHDPDSNLTERIHDALIVAHSRSPAKRTPS